MIDDVGEEVGEGNRREGRAECIRIRTAGRTTNERRNSDKGASSASVYAFKHPISILKHYIFTYSGWDGVKGRAMDGVKEGVVEEVVEQRKEGMGVLTGIGSDVFDDE